MRALVVVLFKLPEPEFIVMIGIPASLAFCSEAFKAAKSGTETIRPPGFLATAASMSWLIFTMSKVSGAL